MNHHVFGPIPSRRLGRSLGVDLVSPKSCTLDCVYCEARRTTNLTLQRGELVPVDEVIRELDRVLSGGVQLDYITFSGAGEPTLNSRIGEVVDHIKTKYGQYRLCLLTNGTLFNDEKLLAEIGAVDLVIPSFDASDEEEFQKINRPAPGLDFAMFLTGIRKFCTVFRGRIVLELFIVPGVNDSDASIARFIDLIKPLRNIEKVQLNTLDRPGAYDWVSPAPPETVKRFLDRLSGAGIAVEAVRHHAVTPASPVSGGGELSELEQKVLELILRRPATAKDVIDGLSLTPEKTRQVLESLEKRGRIIPKNGDRGIFFELK